MSVMSLGPPVCGAIPMSKSTILPGGAGTIPLSRQFATLPRKTMTYGGTLGRSTQAPLPPRRDPKTTLSVGRARAKSMVAGLGKLIPLFNFKKRNFSDSYIFFNLYSAIIL